jgi:lysophospholipase L1-like esterase
MPSSACPWPVGLPPLAARLFLAVAICPWSGLGAAEPASEPRFELAGGDRVVLLGDAIIEREGERGAIETALVATHPDANLTFRNLGWSGDTVWAESRGVFDAPSAGYARLLDLVRGLEPTVVIVAYGRNESFSGAAGLVPFREQLGRLCRDLRGPPQEAGAKAPPTRLVLVTPPPFEATPPLSAAAAAARNATLSDYAAAIRELAVEEGAGIVDLFSAVEAHLPAGARLTENGVHLSDAGYDAAAAVFAATCGKPLSGDFAGRTAAIRAAVNEKNRLFFHRWRPANETYLFLFRRHEQGNNAVEIPQFDPLVEAAEATVRKLAQESP